jgi:uncharacterized protein YbjT (DUF2867 family)
VTITSVAILGGTGQTGAAIAASLRKRGIEALQLSRRDLASHALAVWREVDAAYLIAPNMYADEPQLIRTYLDLVQRSGISRVVYHSVAAPYSPAMKHHMGKAVSEDLVRRSGLAWTIVQPCAYMQNFTPGLTQSEIRVPFNLDARFDLVDLGDVGDAAAIICGNEGHVGATYELGGPASMSIREAATIATEVLSRTVSAIAETPQDWVARVGAQMSAQASDMFVDMWRYYDQYGLPTGGVPLRALLGRTATSFDQVLRRGL